jgi:preprotein translocase subunit SecG
MLAFVVILIIVVCILLIGIVLIQNPKGGGVNASLGGASQQIFGAARSTDVIEKTTWTLAVLLLVLSISTAFFIDKRGRSVAKNAKKDKATTTEVSDVEKRLKETGALNVMPQAPAQQQQQQAPAQQAPAQQPAQTGK